MAETDTNNPLKNFKAYLKLQMQEAAKAKAVEAPSPFNVWVTGVRFEHPPTLEEANRHWDEYGLYQFGIRFRAEHPFSGDTGSPSHA